MKRTLLILGLILFFLTLTTSVFLIDKPSVFGYSENDGQGDTGKDNEGTYSDDNSDNSGDSDSGYESGGYDYGSEGSYDFGGGYSGNYGDDSGNGGLQNDGQGDTGYDNPGTYDGSRTKSGLDNIKDLLSGDTSFVDGAKIVGANMLDAAASFFAVNLVSEVFTGKTIGEHLGVKTVVSDVYDAFKGALQGFGIDVTPSANVDVGHEGDDTRNLFPVARLAPAIEFYGDKRTIDEGDELTLSWSVANAESCVGLDSWSGPKPFSGSLTISDLTTNSIFTLSCKSADGSYRSRSVFVVVLDPTKSVSSSAGAGGSESGGAGAQNGTTLIVPDPTLTLIAEPETVSYGESVHLVWQSENATLCSGADDWPRSQAVSPGEEKYERASGDKAIFFVTNDKLFTLICYGADGRAVQKSVTVEVVSPAVATTTATTTP